MEEYPVYDGVPLDPILGPINNAAVYSKCNQVSDLWQQQKVTYELDSDLINFVDRGRKRLGDVSSGKA